jgi:hypothetical protein
VSKFVPLIVTDVPAAPTDGLKPEIVGAIDVVTTNEVLLFAEPFGDVIEMMPVVALAGTVTTSRVVVAEVTDAAVPLNVTVFCPGVALKPVPSIVTVCPIGPASGVNSMIATSVDIVRVMLRRLPTAS